MFSKKFIPFILLCFFLYSSFLHTLANAADLSDTIVISNQIHQLLKVSSEQLDPDKVASIFEIVNNNQQYSHEVTAKAFLLSARVASNQGDINQVFHFAKKGLAVGSLDKTIRFCLLLNLAEVFVVKKEFQKLLELTKGLVEESSVITNVKYHLLALSYRSVALSMLGKHQEALEDLQQVEQSIKGGDLSERIKFLTIFALAYHHLKDYQTSLTMQLKILKLRFKLSQTENIDQTYLYLGYAYFYLQRFDDAYTAFWESRIAAEQKGAPINLAHANKGLALILIKKHDEKAALPLLRKAVSVFSLHSMRAEHVESLIALAKAMIEVNQKENAHTLIAEVLTLLNGEDIWPDYSIFNRMVADMYYDQKKYKRAYQWRIKDSELLLAKIQSHKDTLSILNNIYRSGERASLQADSIEKSKKLAVNLAVNSNLSSNFAEKYKTQYVVIISLSLAVFLLSFCLLWVFLRLRAKAINRAYEEVEKPSYLMSAPTQTKYYYQLSFKKARQYQYPLSVAYLVIDNWQELVFHFNQKIINEIIKDIASIINLQLSDFDYAGLLNDGEYLLLFEYQNNEEVSEKINKLIQAINSRSFANLGNFSVVVKYSLNSPGFKDIDPYLFLASIAESINPPQTDHPKVS